MVLQSLDQLLEVVTTRVYRAWYTLPRRSTLPELDRLRRHLADKLAALPQPVDMTVYEQALIDYGGAIRTLPGVADAAGPELVDLADAVPAAQRGGFALLRKTDATPERIAALVTLLRAENPPQFAIEGMIYAPEQTAAAWDAVWSALGPRLDEIPGEERTQTRSGPRPVRCCRERRAKSQANTGCLPAGSAGAGEGAGRHPRGRPHLRSEQARRQGRNVPACTAGSLRRISLRRRLCPNSPRWRPRRLHLRRRTCRSSRTSVSRTA